MSSKNNDKTRVLLPILLLKLQKEGESSPRFVGEFYGTEGLPPAIYPPVYYWLDSKSKGIQLSFNNALIDKWIIEVANDSGIKASKTDILLTRQAFTRMAIKSFQSTMSKIYAKGKGR